MPQDEGVHREVYRCIYIYMHRDTFYFVEGLGFECLHYGYPPNPYHLWESISRVQGGKLRVR